MSQDIPASPERHRLDNLPVEAIRQIAASGPCSSALSLLRVNHTIHDACKDWTVFKGIIENNANSDLWRPRWTPFTSPSIQPEKSFWLRYALADLKGIQFLMSPDKVTASELAKWAPQLIAMYHPLLSFVNKEQLLNCFQGHNLKDSPALSFCLTAWSLSDPLESGGVVTQRRRLDLYSDLMLLDKKCFDTLDLITLDQDLELPSFRHTDNGAVGRIHQIHHHDLPTSIILPLAYKALRVFYYRILVMHSAGKSSIERYSNFSDLELVTILIPPMACQIPFLTFMTAPLPLSFSSADMFHNCHLPAMTTPEFIESREWAGYFCSNQDMRPGGKPAFNVPVRRIRFWASIHEEHSILDLCLSTLFNSKTSPLHFEGKLLRDCGKMILVLYFHTTELKVPMQAIVTPFGVVASHGSGNLRSGRGYGRLSGLLVAQSISRSPGIFKG